MTDQEIKNAKDLYHNKMLKYNRLSEFDKLKLYNEYFVQQLSFMHIRKQPEMKKFISTFQEFSDPSNLSIETDDTNFKVSYSGIFQYI